MQGTDTSGEVIEPRGAAGEFVRKQPILALSGIGTVAATMKSLLRRAHRVTTLKFPNPFRVPRSVSRYVKGKNFKYAALGLVLLVSVRKVRSILNY